MGTRYCGLEKRSFPDGQFEHVSGQGWVHVLKDKGGKEIDKHLVSGLPVKTSGMSARLKKRNIARGRRR